MKKYTFIIAVLLAAGLILLGSCVLGSSGGQGDVIIDTSALTGARSLADPDENDYVRVYMLSGENSFLQMASGALYVEEQVDGSVTIPDVPSGEWRVLITYGTKSGEAFVPAEFGASETTFIAPGVETPVSITLGEIPVKTSALLAGKSINGVVSIGDTMYAATADTVYKGQTAAGIAAAADIDFEGTVNSISRGLDFIGAAAAADTVPEVWINTTTGIFSETLGADTNLLFDIPEKSIKTSTVLLSGETLMLFYKSTEGFAGAVKNIPFTEISWNEAGDMGGALKADLVSDFILTEDYFYCVTPFGTMQIAKETFDGKEEPDILAAGKFITVKEGGEKLPILALAYDSGKMYFGTAKGAYVAALDAEGLPTADPVIVSGTEGLSINKIAVNAAWAAFAAPLKVIIREKAGSGSYELPFYAGLPGTVTDLVWQDGANVLLIAGDNSDLASGGFVTLDMAEVQ